MKMTHLGLIFFALATSAAQAQINKPNFWNTLLKKNPVAMDKKSDSCFVRDEQMIPRGSALITISGDLKKQGISAIIHAATGSMTKSDGVFEPTLESVKNSIKNSLMLARHYNHKRVAIPFLAGGIFAGRMGVTKEELAKAIVEASLDYKKKLEVVFVLYSDSEEQIFAQALKSASETKARKKKSKKASVVKGSITDFSLHQATAIVNAANMEVAFGGGISGFIGQATGQSEALDAKAQELIKTVGRSCQEEAIKHNPTMDEAKEIQDLLPIGNGN
jgi:O-acetyl-ADP-ribose deacetylase (regulator of RNase III)